MKVLSIRQPWAWLICAGYKDVENRDWRTNYRGRILIHAPKKIESIAILSLPIPESAKINFHAGILRPELYGD